VGGAEGCGVKVSDEMVDAAVKAWNDSRIFDTTLAMRAAMEAAIKAYVPASRSQAAKDRWKHKSPIERQQHMKAALKVRHKAIFGI